MGCVATPLRFILLTILTLLFFSPLYSQQSQSFSIENGLQVDQSKELQYSNFASVDENMKDIDMKQYVDMMTTDKMTVTYDEQERRIQYDIELRLMSEWTAEDWNSYIRKTHVNTIHKLINQ